MNKILLLLLKYNGFILFVLLELLCTYIISNNSNYHLVSLLNSSNYFSGSIYNISNNTIDYLNLSKINDSLATENAKLRSQSKTAYFNNEFILKTKTNDFQQVYTFIESQVINNSTTKFNNYITLNKGNSEHIKPNMGIISDKGIIGITKSCSDHFTSAYSILHQDIKISAKLKNGNYFGTISWNGQDPNTVSLSEIPKHVVVNIGDIVETSGYSALFPKGIKIGIVKKIKLLPGESYYDIDVGLAEDLNNINYVYVVNYLMKDEQTNLESTNEN